MTNKYGQNINWFLKEVASADKDQLEGGKIEILSETDAGPTHVCTIDLSELCGSANARIKELEYELGQTRISLERKTTLLASCEKALEERDAKHYSEQGV